MVLAAPSDNVAVFNHVTDDQARLLSAHATDDVARLRAAASLGMTAHRVRSSSGLTVEEFRSGLEAFVGHNLEDRGI
jgi:hypothetical protein